MPAFRGHSAFVQASDRLAGGARGARWEIAFSLPLGGAVTSPGAGAMNAREFRGRFAFCPGRSAWQVGRGSPDWEIALRVCPGLGPKAGARSGAEQNNKTTRVPVGVRGDGICCAVGRPAKPKCRRFAAFDSSTEIFDRGLDPPGCSKRSDTTEAILTTARSTTSFRTGARRLVQGRPLNALCSTAFPETRNSASDETSGPRGFTVGHQSNT